MRKKLLILVVVIIALVGMTFTGCGDGAQNDNGSGGAAGSAGDSGSDNGSSGAAEDPSGNGASAPAGDGYEAIIAAIESYNTIENATMDVDVQILMNMAGEEMAMGTSGPVQLMIIDGKPQMAMQLTISSDGSDMTMDYYYKDGYMYTEFSGMKFKQAASEEEMMDTGSIKAQTFEEEYVKDIKVEENADGTLYTILLDGKALDSLVADAMGPDAGLMDAGEVIFEDATILVQLGNDGALLMQDTTMSFTMSAEGQEVSADIHSLIDNIQIGAAAIVFPDDLDSYEEMPE